MLFEIHRTSGSSNKPCEEAFSHTFMYTQKRKFKSFHEYDEVNAKFNGPFVSEGINHRVLENGIARDVLEDRWAIDIGTLDELAEFVQNIDEEVIISPLLAPNGSLSLEIYDDWRE